MPMQAGLPRLVCLGFLQVLQFCFLILFFVFLVLFFNFIFQHLIYFKLIFMICFIFFPMKLSHTQINIPPFYWCLILQASIFVVIFLSSKLPLDLPSRVGHIELTPTLFFLTCQQHLTFFILKNKLIWPMARYKLKPVVFYLKESTMCTRTRTQHYGQQLCFFFFSLT